MARRLLFSHSWHLTTGLFLIIVGIYLFAREIGAVSADFPFWPVIFVSFGIFIAAGEMSKR